MPIDVGPLDSSNQQLLENVHPGNWENPVPSGRYHLVVVGAGTGGLVSAAIAAGLGARVALIERGLMGGDCLNAGCVPSKALLRVARAAADIRRAGEFGIRALNEPRLDFAAVMERMRRLRSQLSRVDSAARFRELGVDVFFGTARFVGPDTVDVGGQQLRFRKAIIATGTHPALPSIPGLAETNYYTNETIFSLTALPGSFAVIGGGPIGCELAQAFARFGSRVTLLQRGPRLLPRDDAEGAAVIENALRRDGVDVILNSRIEQIRNGIIEITSPAVQSIAAESILVAAGRTPNTAELNLEAAGIEYSAKGVHVDDRLRTSNRRVFAVGDICSSYKFTHAADAMARLAVRNALFLGRGRMSRLSIPWCTYTDPEIAHVGLTPDEALRQGIAIRTFTQSLEHVDRAVLDGDAEGFVKVHVRAGTDQIIGGTIVARHAGDLISELNLAKVHKIGLSGLSGVIHPYPTQAEAIRKIGDQYLRSKLSPFVKWLLRWWLGRG